MASKRKIVIAGGGTAGWMTAAALAKLLGKTLDVQLVESEEIGTVGVGEATIPTLHIFHELLGLKESEVMAATNATFKLGISFADWWEAGKEYLHSFGVLGRDCWAAQFHHFWLKGKERGIVHPIGDYCLEHLAAREGRFAVHPNQQRNHAYHMDAGLYARYLRKFSERRGVKRVEGKIKEVQLHASSGHIEALHLESGKILSGDLFIDCTGFKGLLIEQALHTGYDDWSHWLPCDRAIAVQTEGDGELNPYTRSIAHPAGWQWRIPLQTRTGNGMVYCSRYWSEDDALKSLMQNLEEKTLTEPRSIPFRTGTRRLHWNKNCVAIGLSSGFIEPLESTSIHLIQRSIIKLMLLLPSTQVCQSEMDEFNRQTREELEHIRDFIVLHYRATKRSDSGFWQHCGRMAIPETLQHRINLFRDSGRIYKYDKDLFAPSSWVQVMLGQGISPRAWHPIVDMMGDQELQNFLEDIYIHVKKRVTQLPRQQEFIPRYCPFKNIPVFVQDEISFRVTSVGESQSTVLCADDVNIDGGAGLREIAATCQFVAYESEYPGMRAELPREYVTQLLEKIVPVLYEKYQIPPKLMPAVKQRDFSLVTQTGETLAPIQKIPHLDSTYPWFFAVLHYLGEGEHGDTGFFRHNVTNLERVSEAERIGYFNSVNQSIRENTFPEVDIKDNAQYSLQHRIPYKTNRLAIYPGNLLHTILVNPQTDITSDVHKGRLTANMFLVFE